MKTIQSLLVLVALTASAVVATVHADDRRGQRDPGRGAERYEQRQGANPQPRDDRGQQGNRGGNGNDGAEGRRNSGRMTPDERRALRQQIDEAGHDIYRPRR